MSGRFATSGRRHLMTVRQRDDVNELELLSRPGWYAIDEDDDDDKVGCTRGGALPCEAELGTVLAKTRTIVPIIIVMFGSRACG